MTKVKVLVVDDEIHIIHVVAIKLRNNGFEVFTAENGQDAYELACQEKPDIVVTDFQMPVMTGVQFVKKLRKNEETRDIPVVMLTARGFAIDEDKKEDLRITQFLSKPFSPKELLKSIEDVMLQKTMAHKD
jgi:two-component system alkaline phosphatase synthesis response regulator PhoP